MKQLYLIFALFILACKSEPKASVSPSLETAERSTQEAEDLSNLSFPVYNFQQLEELLLIEDEAIHIVNFWATWCAPCIKELPYFEALAEKYKADNVTLLLVSLDFPRQYETKLMPFIKEKQLKAQVVALNDLDMNTWIPAIDSTWSGAIPATLIYSKDQRKFYEQSFNYESLEAEIKTFLNKK